MGRNVALQVIRGIAANIPILNDAEFYFATDTGQLYVGLNGLNYRIGVPAMANVTVQGNANPTHFIEPNVDGSIVINAASLPLPANAAQETGGNLATIAGQMPPTTAKGVQALVFANIQEAKDTGRVIKIFTASFTAATTEGLVTLTPITDGAAGTTGTSFTVTAGKRFRIQALMLTCFNITAAIHACQINLRTSSSGAITTASPIIATVGTTTAAATINEANSQAQSFPDGIELSGTMQFGISQIGIALAGQTVSLIGYEY